MSDDAEVLPDLPVRGGLVRRTPSDVVLMPVMNVQLAQKRLTELQEFCASYLQESNDGGTDGGDYGAIPGAGSKKVLFKSGADKLCDVYGLADRYCIVSRVEDFDRGLFDYTIECELVRKTDEMFVGSGLGSCSSYESKYRWRDAHRKCPQCHTESIIKGKAEYGGGWLCWAKKGGCGAKYADTDPAIIGQNLSRVENPDIIDAKNTVLKIAKKRAKIDAVIGVTRSSGIFSQDLEDHVTQEPPAAGDPEPQTHAPTRPAAVEETHAEKIARVKAQQAANRQSAEPTTPAQDAPTVTMGANAHKPVEKPANGGNGKATSESADGCVEITGINVKTGQMVIKDGKQVPSWGPLYIITFSQKVKADNGVAVADASTFDEKLAVDAETARDAKTRVRPTVVAAKKAGTYNLTKMDPAPEDAPA